MADGQAGFNCVLYIASDEVTEADNVTLADRRGEIEDTARDTDGYKSYIGGLGDWTVTLHLKKKYPRSTAAQAIETAYRANTIIPAITIVDSEGYGLTGACAVTEFGEEQPLEGAVGNPVTLRGRGKPTAVTPAS